MHPLLTPAVNSKNGFKCSDRSDHISPYNNSSKKFPHLFTRNKLPATPVTFSCLRGNDAGQNVWDRRSQWQVATDRPIVAVRTNDCCHVCNKHSSYSSSSFHARSVPGTIVYIQGVSFRVDRNEVRSVHSSQKDEFRGVYSFQRLSSGVFIHCGICCCF